MRMKISTPERILVAALLCFVLGMAVFIYQVHRNFKKNQASAQSENAAIQEVKLSLRLADFIHQLNATATYYNGAPSAILWQQCAKRTDSVHHYLGLLAHSGAVSSRDTTVLAFLTVANRWIKLNNYYPERFRHAFTGDDLGINNYKDNAALNDTLWILTAALVADQAAIVDALHREEERADREQFWMFLLLAALAFTGFLIFLERLRVLFNRRREEERIREDEHKLLETRIAERTRELQQANEQFLTINQITSEVIWDWNIKEGKLWWNQNFYKLLGYREDEIPVGSEAWIKVVHPDDLPELQKKFEATLQSEAGRWEEEFRCIAANGEIVYLYDRGAILRDEAGKPIRLLGSMLDITPLKKALEMVAMESNLSNTLIDSLPGLFCIYNKNNELIRWNKEAERVGGYAASELAGSNPLQFFEAAEMPRLETAMAKAIAVGENDMETNLVTKAGEKIPYFFRGRAIQVAGEPYFISIGIDISARRKAEQALTASEQKYRLLFYSSPMPMLMISLPSYDISDVNESAVKHYGYSRLEFLSLNARDLRPVDEVARFEEKVIGARLDGTTHMGKWTHLKKNGERMLVEITAHDLKLAGESQRLLLINDITAREEAQQGLMASEKRLRDTMDNMMEGAQILSFDWRFLYLNHAAVQPSRVTREELLGQNALEKYPQVVHTNLYRRMERCMLLREPQRFEDEFGYPDGGSSWFEFHIQPVPEGIFILSVDVTERIKNARALKELNESLEQKVALRTTELMEVNKSLEEFSYSVSHDLRGPLRSILGFLDIMQQDYAPKLDDDLRGLITYAENAGRRMNAIIDDLLTLAKYGKDKLRLEKLNTALLVQQVWDELVKESGTRADLQIAALPEVNADTSMLRQVFTNLLGNALKYSAKKEKPQINVTAAEENGQITITVKDNGAGFDMKYYDRLFLPFQRLHGITEFEGTGVGLVLVKKIVEKHGGRIWAEGKVEEGAAFSFTLESAD